MRGCRNVRLYSLIWHTQSHLYLSCSGFVKRKEIVPCMLLSCEQDSEGRRQGENRMGFTPVEENLIHSCCPWEISEDMRFLDTKVTRRSRVVVVAPASYTAGGSGR